jgi:predicted permease
MPFRSMWIWSVVMALVLAAVDVSEGPSWVSAAIGFAFLTIAVIVSSAGIALAMAVQDEANDHYRIG